MKASRPSSIRRTWSSRELSPIADDQRVVDLIGLRALGRDVAFDQRRAGVLAEPQQRAREHRRGRGAAGDMNDMQRLRQHDAIGDLDHHAIGHHRAVERDHRIGVIGRRTAAPAARRRRPPARRASVRIGRPFSRPSSSESFGANTPSTSTSRRTPLIACSFRAAAARFSAAASGAGASGSTSRISARRSVYFQSSIRRCGRPARS